MKRYGSFLVLILALSLFTGCHSDIDTNLSTLERKVSTLYDKINEVNINSIQLKGVFDKLESYDFVKNVKRDYSYDTETYVITFTHSDPITLSCGSDGVTPVIGLEYDEDGRAYWTVKNGDGETEYLYYDDGTRVSVNSTIPQLRISEDGKWEISTDGGQTWKSLGVSAQGASGTSFVESVDVVDGYLKITLLSGDVISLPTQESYDALMSDIEALNNNIKSITEVVKKMQETYIYVKGYSPIVDGQDSVGFKITLSDDSSYSFYHGESTNKPSVIAQRDTTDSLYYWAIKYAGEDDYQWILDESGERVTTKVDSCIYPLFRVSRYEPADDGIYYWQISYDGGQTYKWIYDNNNYALVATPTANDAGITGITHITGCYILNVMGQTYRIPDSPQWIIRFNDKQADSLTLQMFTSDTISVTYSISAIGTAPEIASYASEGFKTWVEKDMIGGEVDNFNGKIQIISPATFTADSTYVKVVVSDGVKKINNFNLKVLWKSRDLE